MDLWLLASLASKAASYAAMLAIGGGLLISFLHPTQLILTRYLLPASVLGLLSVCLYFLVQVGQVQQQGVAGMFDLQMGMILADSTLGRGLQWRLGGFVLAGLAVSLICIADSHARFATLLMPGLLMGVAGVLALGISFAVLGHVNMLDTDARIAVVVHFVAVSAWLGSLWPLYLICRHDSESEPQRDSVISLLERYGQLGWWLLGTMLISGLWLAFRLLSGWGALLSSTHGRFLLLKLCLVAMMMALGAAHKFYWVKRLRAGVGFGRSMSGFTASLSIEMVVAALVIIATALMTTISGPFG